MDKTDLDVLRTAAGEAARQFALFALFGPEPAGVFSAIVFEERLLAMLDGRTGHGFARLASLWAEAEAGPESRERVYRRCAFWQAVKDVLAACPLFELFGVGGLHWRLKGAP